MNPNNFRIRPVEASHVIELIRIGEETNLSPWSAEGYLDEIKNPAAVMLRLIDDENSILGFIVGRIIVGGEVEARLDAEIYNIAVIEQYQQNGCGQRLFDEFVAKCREKGVVSIWLEVRESNLKAIRFYEKHGFRRIQTRPTFYKNPRENALVMRLVLSELPA